VGGPLHFCASPLAVYLMHDEGVVIHDIGRHSAGRSAFRLRTLW
jgi:hypothetical protein